MFGNGFGSRFIWFGLEYGLIFDGCLVGYVVDVLWVFGWILVDV